MNGSDQSACSPAGTVLTRYDELADLLASVVDRPLAEPVCSARAEAVLNREARWLDHRAFSSWLGWFSDDAVLWVPMADGAHPATDQSWFLDDRRRLAERAAWLATPSAWGQHPPSVCVRTIGAVEAWPTPDGVVVHSSFTLVEHRSGQVQLVAGHQVHELTGPELACRSKIVRLPRLADGLCNPSFLL